jgi:hypothetical protein
MKDEGGKNAFVKFEEISKRGIKRSLIYKNHIDGELQTKVQLEQTWNVIEPELTASTVIPIPDSQKLERQKDIGKESRLDDPLSQSPLASPPPSRNVETIPVKEDTESVNRTSSHRSLDGEDIRKAKDKVFDWYKNFTANNKSEESKLKKEQKKKMRHSVQILKEEQKQKEKEKEEKKENRKTTHFDSPIISTTVFNQDGTSITSPGGKELPVWKERVTPIPSKSPVITTSPKFSDSKKRSSDSLLPRRLSQEELNAEKRRKEESQRIMNRQLKERERFDNYQPEDDILEREAAMKLAQTTMSPASQQYEMKSFEIGRTIDIMEELPEPIPIQIQEPFIQFENIPISNQNVQKASIDDQVLFESSFGGGPLPVPATTEDEVTFTPGNKRETTSLIEDEDEDVLTPAMCRESSPLDIDKLAPPPTLLYDVELIDANITNTAPDSPIIEMYVAQDIARVNSAPPPPLLEPLPSKPLSESMNIVELEVKCEHKEKSGVISPIVKPEISPMEVLEKEAIQKLKDMELKREQCDELQVEQAIPLESNEPEIQEEYQVKSPVLEKNLSVDSNPYAPLSSNPNSNTSTPVLSKSSPKLKMNEIKVKEISIEEEPLLNDESDNEEEIIPTSAPITESIHNDLEKKMDSALEAAKVENVENEERNETELLRRNFKPLSLSSSYTADDREPASKASPEKVNLNKNIITPKLNKNAASPTKAVRKAPVTRVTPPVTKVTPPITKVTSPVSLFKRLTPIAIAVLAVIWLMIYHIYFPQTFLVNGEDVHKTDQN